MGCATHSRDFGVCGDRTAPVANRPSSGDIARRKTGVFDAIWRRLRPGEGAGARLKRLARRLIDALEAQRRSEVDREIARLLAQSGGRLTDSLEREIMQKVFASDWSLPH